MRADSVRADSVRADSVRADSVRADSVRADSVRADSVRADSSMQRTQARKLVVPQVAKRQACQSRATVIAMSWGAKARSAQIAQENRWTPTPCVGTRPARLGDERVISGMQMVS